MNAAEGLGSHGRAICSDGGTDGHEEALSLVRNVMWFCDLRGHTQKSPQIPSCTVLVFVAFHLAPGHSELCW